MGERSRPSASGARLSGDRYQHLFTWLYAAQMLITDPSVIRIEFEKAGAGNVDDLVVHYSGRPPVYHQIKFTTSQEEALTPDWFTTVPRGASRSPLQRFYASYEKLTEGGVRPELALLTNRWPEEADVLRSCTDGWTTKLTPRITEGGAGSQNGQLRKAWAEHLGVSEEELLEFLSHLSLKVGRESLDELHESCSLAMRAAGLRADAEAISVAADLISWCIEKGIRELTPDALRDHVHERNLVAGRASGSLLIQCLKADPWPEGATVALDWVDLFDGDEPANRRQLRDPDDWEGRLKPELREAVQTIQRHGFVDVDVRGSMRLSTALFAGTELSRVAGFNIETTARGGTWSSSVEPPATEITTSVIEIGGGEDVAVGLSVAIDLAEDVVRYIEQAELPVGRLLLYSPEHGPGWEAVSSPEAGVGLAHSIARALRRDTAGATKLHMFQATPMPLSLMIGHLWNRMPETQMYDDLGAGKGYAPTFRIAG